MEKQQMHLRRSISLDEKEVDECIEALKAHHQVLGRPNFKLLERLEKWKNQFEKPKPKPKSLVKRRGMPTKPGYLLFKEGKLLLRKVNTEEEYYLELHFGERKGNEFDKIHTIGVKYLNTLLANLDLCPRSIRLIDSWKIGFHKFMAYKFGVDWCKD